MNGCQSNHHSGGGTAARHLFFIWQGIWAALYIYLFFRMLKENAQREEKYQGMIENLSGNILKGIDDIQSRLDDMSQDVKKQDK